MCQVLIASGEGEDTKIISNFELVEDINIKTLKQDDNCYHQWIPYKEHRKK